MAHRSTIFANFGPLPPPAADQQLHGLQPGHAPCPDPPPTRAAQRLRLLPGLCLPGPAAAQAHVGPARIGISLGTKFLIPVIFESDQFTMILIRDRELILNLDFSHFWNDFPDPSPPLSKKFPFIIFGPYKSRFLFISIFRTFLALQNLHFQLFVPIQSSIFRPLAQLFNFLVPS